MQALLVLAEGGANPPMSDAPDQLRRWLPQARKGGRVICRMAVISPFNTSEMMLAAASGDHDATVVIGLVERVLGRLNKFKRPNKRAPICLFRRAVLWQRHHPDVIILIIRDLNDPRQIACQFVCHNCSSGFADGATLNDAVQGYYRRIGLRIYWPRSKGRKHIAIAMMIVVILAGLFALGGRGHFAAAVIALGVVELVLQVLVIFITESWFDFLAELTGVLFFMSLCLVLLLSVFAPGRITVNRVLGAIAVYLLLAMFFAESFDIVDRLTEGEAFIMGQQPTPYTTPSARYFYLSVISLTSVGFGDLAPVHPFARSLVMLSWDRSTRR